MATGKKASKYLTLGEASKETGVQKSTLSKALKSGKLSYIEKTSAGYQIDPSELFRVYPRKPQATVASIVSGERLDTPQNNPDFIRLQVEVEQLRERLNETQTQRDEWQKQAQQLALPKPASTPEPAGQSRDTRSLWERVWNKQRA